LGEGAAGTLTLRTALRLGRVSNLPTVWTNTLAGAVLAGGVLDQRLAVMLLAFSLFYTGGMFLNDAFDAAIDARTRPERPIPSGAITRGAVFVYGFLLLFLANALLAWMGALPALAGLGLAAAITFYDWHHKQNPFGPVVMGLCRALVYVAAGLCFTAALPRELWTGALLMLCYLIGLTYIAKQETLGRIENLWPLAFLAAPVVYGLSMSASAGVLPFWLLFTGWVLAALWFLRRRAKGDIPRAVVSLIAGISLLDALLIATTGAFALATLAIAGFACTLFFQRYITGT
jgi:4-hydroxybenzoate polyprenyltransferase